LTCKTLVIHKSRKLLNLINQSFFNLINILLNTLTILLTVIMLNTVSFINFNTLTISVKYDV